MYRIISCTVRINGSTSGLVALTGSLQTPLNLGSLFFKTRYARELLFSDRRVRRRQSHSVLVAPNRVEEG